MQVGDNDQYIVRVDDLRRLTLQNRNFLRKMHLISPDAYYLQQQAMLIQSFLRRYLILQQRLCRSCH